VPEQLEELRDKGIISPLAVKAELRTFQQPIGNYFSESELINFSCHHPADCNQFKSTGYPNFNHFGYVYLSKQLLKDSLALIALDPSQFIFYTLGSYSLTLWHSSDSVHALFENNMEVVKKLEKIYRFLYFGFLGVESKLDVRMWERTIIITILFMIVYISTLINVFRKDDHILTGIKVFCLFCLIIHVYTLLVSSVIEFGENKYIFTTRSIIIALIGAPLLSYAIYYFFDTQANYWLHEIVVKQTVFFLNLLFNMGAEAEYDPVGFYHWRFSIPNKGSIYFQTFCTGVQAICVFAGIIVFIPHSLDQNTNKDILWRKTKALIMSSVIFYLVNIYYIKIIFIVL